VVDDASKDNTSEVVSSFNDRKIKYICHQVNKGGSATRNTGIANSSYEYIAFLDDDDEWLPEKLKEQVDVLENCSPKIGGVYTGHIKVVNNSSRSILEVWTPKKKGDIHNEMFKANWVSTTSSLLLRRECFERVGLFDESLPSFQDYDMWIRISREFHFEYIKEPLVKYYVHENKIWTNLEALSKGMEIMLKKYSQSLALRKNCSRYYLSLGVHYCYNKNTKKGREAFIKAIRLDPFEIRHYFNFGISILGPGAYKKLKEINKKVLSLKG
jgi:glycosyltransferase involved in cell wall biosynthesis